MWPPWCWQAPILVSGKFPLPGALAWPLPSMWPAVFQVPTWTRPSPWRWWPSPALTNARWCPSSSPRWQVPSASPPLSTSCMVTFSPSGKWPITWHAAASRASAPPASSLPTPMPWSPTCRPSRSSWWSPPCWCWAFWRCATTITVPPKVSPPPCWSVSWSRWSAPPLAR